jgi:hypothetical protein
MALPKIFPECVPVAAFDRVIVPGNERDKRNGGQMPREFTSQKALQNHAELTGELYLWEGTPTFATRQQLLSPGQYEIVDVRTSQGMKRAMLFRTATLNDG